MWYSLRNISSWTFYGGLNEPIQEWSQPHKILFSYHFAEKDNKNTLLNLVTQKINSHTCILTGKNRLILLKQICTGFYINRQYLCFLFYLPVISQAVLSHLSQTKCVCTVTYTRWIRSGHLCPAVMFFRDQLYWLWDPWKWGKKRERKVIYFMDSKHH